MWVTIDRETYMQKVKGLKPIESFTDPDGTMEFSCGRPQIETVWGTVGADEEDDTLVVKCNMIKEDRHQKDWYTEYFEYVKPAAKEQLINTMQNFDPKEGQAEATNEQATNAQESASQDAATGAQESAEEGTTEG